MKYSPIYSLRVPEVFQNLETSPSGLQTEEAQARLSLYGSNLLTEPQKASVWKKLAVFLYHPMAIVLWVGGLLALFLGEVALGLIIWLVVLVNAMFSFWMENRAGHAVAALSNLLPSYARVLRDGSEVLVPANEIVPGDLLVLAEGDNIPADARVVEEYGLRTNNTTLTGEAIPARKSADASLLEGISELERPNLIFAGTSVVSGTARAVVCATGMLTQFGRIAKLTQSIEEELSPMQREITRLTRIISLIGIGIGVLVFTLAAFDPESILFIEDRRLLRSFVFALGVIVAVIPEGLPATLTLSLAMAVQRLAQRGVLVKKLAIVERLGNTSVICTDKSGTLTQNQMTVRVVWIGGQRLEVSGVGYEPVGKYSPEPHKIGLAGDLDLLLKAASLCNNSRLNPPTQDKPLWTALGDQTEAALRVAAMKGGIDQQDINLSLPRIHELPFDARRKRMTTVHRTPAKTIAFVKGAPREVLQLCKYILIRGETCELDVSMRDKILSANDDYARNALRVLALATCDLPPRSGFYRVEDVEQDLTFLGLMGMMDPPRPEVSRAVQTCREAGIRMVMVTGDYGLTAETIARRVGMLSEANPLMLTGADMDQLNEEQLQNALNREVIFARMAPEHKLRLVSAFQNRGDVVAVTGDGVNDAPALRKADVGVVMGVVGTDVAREAADIILTDDNFSAIMGAVEEGRAVYNNIRKFITYIFSSNVPELLPFLLTAMFRFPLALSVKQILAIDLGTDLLPALALGTEKPEPDTMKNPPRSRNQPILDTRLLVRSFLWLGMLEAALCYAGFFAVYGISGHVDYFNLTIDQWLNLPAILRSAPIEVYLLAVTIYHAGVVVAQIGNVFACRSTRFRGRQLGWFSNPLLWTGILVEIVVILFLIYHRPLAVMFEHSPLPVEYWAVLALYPFVIYGMDWLRKLAVRWLE